MQNRDLDPSEIIDRLKGRLDVESDAKLAETLGVPSSTLANWRRRRSLPYAVSVRVAQEKGISLDWLILGKEGSALDTSALALAAYHSRDALSLLELGEVEADILGEAIGKWYGKYADSLDRLVATGRTREQATRLLYDTLTTNSQINAVTEVIELQSQRRPAATSESVHAALVVPEKEELPKAPETGTDEGFEPSVEHKGPPKKSGRERGDRNVPVEAAVGGGRWATMPPRFEPGPEHISPEQKNALRKLISEAADYGIARGQSEIHSKGSVHRMLTRRFDVRRYDLIPKQLGNEAIALMTQHVTALRKRFPGADYASWRTALYLAIFHQARELEYSRHELFAIAFHHFGKRITTLKQLSDHNLQKLFDILKIRNPDGSG